MIIKEYLYKYEFVNLLIVIWELYIIKSLCFFFIVIFQMFNNSLFNNLKINIFTLYINIKIFIFFLIIIKFIICRGSVLI